MLQELTTVSSVQDVGSLRDYLQNITLKTEVSARICWYDASLVTLLLGLDVPRRNQAFEREADS